MTRERERVSGRRAAAAAAAARAYARSHRSIHPSAGPRARARVGGGRVCVDVCMCFDDTTRRRRRRRRPTHPPGLARPHELYTYRPTHLPAAPARSRHCAWLAGWRRGVPRSVGVLRRTHPESEGVPAPGLVSSRLISRLVRSFSPSVLGPLPHQARRKPPTRGRRRGIPGACSSPSPHASSIHPHRAFVNPR